MAGIWSEDRRVRAEYERQCCNFRVQSAASGMIKRAMVQLDEEGVLRKYGAMELLQVHDELKFEAPKGKAEGFARELKRVMEGVAVLTVPVVADVGVGENWAELEKVQ